MRAHASRDLHADDEKWKVIGPDEDGDALTCVVVLEAGVVVVTVF